MAPAISQPFPQSDAREFGRTGVFLHFLNGRGKMGSVRSERKLPKSGFGGVVTSASFPVAPSFRPPNNTGRFEATETLGIGEGGQGETRWGEIEKREKGGFGWNKALLLVFRGVPSGPVGFRRAPWGSASFRAGPFCLSSQCPWFRGVPSSAAVVHCARWTFTSPLYSTHQPIPGVSKPPKRRGLGKGGMRKREDRKCENHEHRRL